MLMVNIHVLFNDDNLLTANYSGLRSDQGSSGKVPPCVKYMERVSCYQT